MVAGAATTPQEAKTLAKVEGPIQEAVGALIKSGLIRRALIVVNAVLASDRSFEMGWHVKCSILDQLAYFDIKLKLLEIAVDVGAPLTIISNNMQELIDRGILDSALDSAAVGLKKAKSGPLRQRLLEEVAWLYAEKGQAEWALDYAGQAVEADGQSGRAHYLRGRALCLLGNLKEGEKEILRVLDCPPGGAGLRWLLFSQQGVLEGRGTFGVRLLPPLFRNCLRSGARTALSWKLEAMGAIPCDRTFTSDPAGT